jgi:MFS family permease
MIYFAGWMLFKYFRVVQEDKQIRPVNPRKTFRALWKNTVDFFRLPGMLRAYLVNFGYYSLRAMRVLYVPILVIENGFSKDVLGWVLTLGIIPYLILSEFMGRAVQRTGKNLWLILGFGSFALLSAFATVVTGVPLLIIFVAWQISGALMESVHDLLFFDNTKKVQQTRFYGVFRTSANLPNVLVPVFGAAMIAIYGTTAAVWAVTATIGALSIGVLISRK